MHNSASKISDLSIHSEDKKDIVARHMYMLENYCEEIFICYDILCNDVIEVVFKTILEMEKSMKLIDTGSSNRHNNNSMMNSIEEKNEVYSNNNSGTRGAISKTTSGDSDNNYDKIDDGITL